MFRYAIAAPLCLWGCSEIRIVNGDPLAPVDTDTPVSAEDTADLADSGETDSSYELEWDGPRQEPEIQEDPANGLLYAVWFGWDFTCEIQLQVAPAMPADQALRCDGSAPPWASREGWVSYQEATQEWAAVWYNYGGR